MSNENPLLKQQITSLEELNKLYVESDSIRKVEVTDLENRVKSDNKKIQQLKNNQKKIILGSSIGGIILFILGLIL